MKYKVSVIKKIAFLVMTMALAVAMVACSGAAGTPGPAGPAGQDAPTPDPTTPTDPTDPPDPPGPTGEPPVAKPISPVYLALEGTGQALLKAIELDTYITDADSQIKFTAKSSADTVATALLPEGTRKVTIKALKVGTATITVTARDGDNDPVEAPISVTVVRSNDLPTTNDLSKAARDELQKRLYVSEGLRTDTITVEALPGSTSSETLADSIVDFKVMIGAAAATDDLVTVTADSAGIKDKYVISVTPKPGTLTSTKRKQAIKIYPMDKFGVTSAQAWEFDAMFNTPPETDVDSFGTIRLSRPEPTGNEKQSLVALDVGLPGAAPNSGNAVLIKISDYFNLSSLQIRGISNTTPPETDGNTVSPSEVNLVGDTACEVTVDTKLAAVQELNEAGEDNRFNGATPPVIQPAAKVVKNDLVSGTGELTQALYAILIDSRVSSFGKGIESGEDGAPGMVITPGYAPDPADATKSDGAGAFNVTIRCSDPDNTAEVTGTVVVRVGAATTTGG